MTRKFASYYFPRLVAAALGLMLLGCATPETQKKHDSTYQRINEELKQAAQPAKPEQPEVVTNALLPPLKIEMPKGSDKALEPRFDLVVHNAPARQVFMGIVSGTRYSMVPTPDLEGTITANLKDVTVLEALEDIRETHGYEYKVVGSRIYIQAQAIQTRVFKVNYLVGTRTGSTSVRVLAGSTGAVGATGAAGTTGATGTMGTTGTTGAAAAGGRSGGSGSTTITTNSSSNFWNELSSSLKAIVGSSQGRSVVISPQSGVIVVRATPQELRNVAEFLNASQLSVERQVILEAKILEVELSDDYQTGVNWAAFKSNSEGRVSVGVPGSNEVGPIGALRNSNDMLSGVPGSTLRGSGGLFGLVFQTNSFAAMLSFLESQGSVQVLSSPRISTLNNQKAVLKVGSEDYYVTSVTSGTSISTTGTTTTTQPTPTIQQFFSGIVLDVTPQIDQNSNVILHIHPSVTRISEVNKVINMGSSGTMTLPLASTNVSETDSIVRARDGQIVVLGGLMKQTSSGDQANPPGLNEVPFLRQTKRSTKKSELIILLKPTIVQDGSDWSQDVLDTQRRVQAMGRE